MSEKHEAQITLIREILGLSAIHDPVEAVRVLFERGRPAMEAMRGPHHSDKQPGGPAGGLLGWPWGEGVIVCRGSLALGTGCGHCQKCLKERAEGQAFKQQVRQI